MSSVLRRYTPPTCTLEIAAKGSPLSRWTDRPVLKQLRFQLSFDDPKLPPEQQVKVRGDRAQLEVLCEAVDTYIQQTLSQPAATLVPLRHDPRPMPPEEAEISGGAGIHLKPRGLLSHDLCLGVLATEESGPVVHLSALQLFDLANALDEYSAESLAIPSLGRSKWLSMPTGWARIAAIAVLALGASTVLAKFVMDVSSPTAVQTASTSATQESSNSTTLDAPAASDEFPDVTLLPDASKTSPPALGNLEALPPPPTPGAVQPPPPSLPSVAVPGNPTVVAPAPAAPTARSAPPPAQAPASPSPAARPPQNQAPVALSIPETNAPASANNGAGQSPVEGLSEVSPEAADSAARQAAVSSGTAFDSIPQIAEVRSYFQERWQPPEGLEQTLEYRLVLNSDGSLQQITPLGTAAGTYLDRTAMPLLNEPFVSPTDGGQTPQVRLVLRPDGAVQTFADPGR